MNLDSTTYHWAWESELTQYAISHVLVVISSLGSLKATGDGVWGMRCLWGINTCEEKAEEAELDKGRKHSANLTEPPPMWKGALEPVFPICVQ
jgi:hypothetical protein